MYDNPDLVGYLTDDEKAIAKAKYAARTAKAVPTAKEIAVNISPNAQRLLAGFQQGEDLPPELERYLDSIAEGYNMTGEQLLNILQAQQ